MIEKNSGVRKIDGTLWYMIGSSDLKTEIQKAFSKEGIKARFVYNAKYDEYRIYVRAGDIENADAILADKFAKTSWW